MIDTLILAEVVTDPSGLNGWFSALFDIAQKLGIGATVVLGVGYYIQWKEKREQATDWKDLLIKKDTQLAQEVTYGKDRDRQTLTLLSELTTVIRNIDTRDTAEVGAASISRRELLEAVKEVGTSVAGLKTMILEHVIKS